MTTSAPPPRDPELAADPDYRQAAAEDWYGRVADYYADQQAEADQEARALAAQDAEPDARQATWSSTASRSTTPSRTRAPRGRQLLPRGLSHGRLEAAEDPPTGAVRIMTSAGNDQSHVRTQPAPTPMGGMGRRRRR